MRFWHRPRSVRVSLTLWYVGAMIVVLGVYATGVFIFVSQSVSRALDSRLRTDFQWASEMWERRPDGTLSWFEGEPGINEEAGPWLQVWNPSGNLLFRTGVAYEHPVPDSDRLATEASGQIISVPTEQTSFRVLSGPSRLGDESVIIQVARSEEPMRREINHLMLMLALGLPLGVAAAGLGGYSLASRALKPLGRMAERAQEITAERLSDRLPVDNPKDELGRLALVFNETLGRLESSFEQMRRFTADVSHELRTPLTAIRNVGEVGLRVRRTDAEYRELIGSMLEEVDRLACLVDQLLAFSRAETGQAKLTLEPIDLAELARNVSGHLGVLAEEKMQSVTVEASGVPGCVGDRLTLRQALINLVDNAIKYSPAGSQIRIHVSQSPHGARIDVRDSGPGIAEETRARIFERFYRVGDSSFEDRGGAGLGLSIAKWAVEANGGHLTLEEAGSSGSTFRIALPNPAR